MIQIPTNTYNAINIVLSCESIYDAAQAFKYNINFLNDCKFIYFVTEQGASIPYFLKNQNIENFSILNLALSSDKFFVIDKDTIKEMDKNFGVANYYIDTCIALDTQAVSYLRNIFTEKAISIPEHHKPFLEYLIKNDINYDYSLYMLENSSKLITMNDKIITYENLLSCERFKAIDVDEYFKSNEIIYTKTNEELILQTDNVIYMMKNIALADDMCSFWDKYHAIYSILLKACLIELSNSQASIKSKITNLLEFINNELGVFCEREIAICYLYFKHDTRIQKFFKKIKSNSNNIIKHISGMAWDLFHLRYLEFLMANIHPTRCKFSLYSLITFDQGLQEVIKAYPVKRCAIYKGMYMPIFSPPLFDFISEVDIKHYNYYLKNVRLNTLNNLNISELINTLETALLKMLNI